MNGSSETQDEIQSEIVEENKIEIIEEIQSEIVDENKIEIKPRGRKTRKSTSGE